VIIITVPIVHNQTRNNPKLFRPSPL